MENDYIPLEDLESHIKREAHDKKMAQIKSESKVILSNIGSAIAETTKFIGRGAKRLAENIEANRNQAEQSKSKNIPQEKSYLMNIAENFAQGSFGDISAFDSMNPYIQKEEKKNVKKKRKQK